MYHPCRGVAGACTAELAGTCTAGARGICTAGARFAWRHVHQPCPVCGVQPLAVDVGHSLFFEAVLPFVPGSPLSDLALVCLLALRCTLGTPVSGRVHRSRTVSSTVPLQHAAWRGVLSSSSGLRSRRAGAQVRVGHLFDSSFLRTARAVIASPFTIKMYSLDFIRKPMYMPDSILSSAFIRSVNGSTRHHTCSPHLPMWRPRPRHCSKGTCPSDPTVSRFSNVACPIIEAMVFHYGGICIWQLNSSSFFSALTMPPTSPTALSANPLPP